MKIRNYLIAFVFLIGYAARSQTIKVTNIGYEQNKVVITYQLQDSVVGRYYTVGVYTSEDDYTNPLKHVEGDVGLEVRPGNERKIYWDVKEEQGAFYEGRIAFELRAKEFIPFISMGGFEEIKTLKRGRAYNITWTGGGVHNVLNFDLYKGEKKVHTFPNIANAGHYKMILPKWTKPGNDYHFKISDTNNSEEVVYTEEFKVRRKIPLAYTAIAVAGVGVGVAVILMLQPEIDSDISDPTSPLGE